MSCTQWIDIELATLQQQGLRRQLQPYAGVGAHVDAGAAAGSGALLNASSNDYLGLSRHPHVLATAQAALAKYGAGATASRLVCGTLTLHEQLEQRLAAHKGYDSALVMGSGFVTNATVLPALVGRDDYVFADRLVHASLIDGIRLSQARLQRFRHNDTAHLQQLLAAAGQRGRRLVVTESVFSMDGDLAPLAEIAALAEAAGAMLLVDEAHAMGVFGPHGSGLVRAAGIQAQVTLCMGTLSKGLGSYGGYVACSSKVRDWLINRCRGFVYSTALPPAALGAALGALDVLDAEPQIGATLLARAAALRAVLQSHGCDVGASASQIIPIMLGDAATTLRVSASLRQRGILAVAIRPPTVPAGSSRLRLSLSLEHDDADLMRLGNEISQAILTRTPAC